MAETTVKKHPIRGAIWGVFMGLGLALILGGQGVIAFGDTTPFIVVVVIGMLVSIVWSVFGPAKAPKGPPPEVDAPAELLDPLEEPSESEPAGADPPTSADPPSDAEPSADESATSGDSPGPADLEDPGAVEI